MQSNGKSPEVVDSSGSDRLDTWKEVAAHLRRSVRTVQRWEREEALPVHRHRHDKQGSIYASKREIDTWWAMRGATLSDGDRDAAGVPAAAADSPPSPPPPRNWYDARRVAMASVACVIGMVAVTLWARSGDLAQPSHAHPHRVLITELENHTGEAALVGRIRDTLQEQLGAARFANVVPADQTAEFLRLMRKPAPTRIDAAIGREIALRDGSIDAFVTGSLDVLESNYVSTIRVLSPADAVVLASYRAVGRTPAQLLDAVRREIRSGERALDAVLAHSERGAGLPRVTTASLRALQLYGEAVKLMDQVPIKTAPAFELLTEAIRLDPAFASAHILAAWSMRNARRPQEAVLPHAERAFQFADATSEAERYFILGSYYQLKVDVDKAIAAYEALLRLDPSHYWALGNLGRLYRAVGRNDAAQELRVRQVALRPRQFWGNFRLAEALFLQGDLQGAEDYAVRAASQVADINEGDLQSRRSWLEILPVCKAWLGDDVIAATKIADDLEATLAKRHGPDRDALTLSLGYMYLALGHRDAANRMFVRLPQPAERLYHLAVVGSLFGDAIPVNAYFASAADMTGVPPLIHGFPAVDPRAAGGSTELLERWSKSLDAADASLLRGQLALMQGRAEQARTMLSESIELREDRFGTPALVASAGVARAWQVSGDAAQAIHTLEESTQNRYRGCLWPTANAHLWVRLRSELAQLYRRVGRDPEARAIETHLRLLMKGADEAHPIAATLAPETDAAADLKPIRD